MGINPRGRTRTTTMTKVMGIMTNTRPTKINMVRSIKIISKVNMQTEVDTMMKGAYVLNSVRSIRLIRQ